MEVRRTRILTEKAMALFKQQDQKLITKYNETVKELENHIASNSGLSVNSSISALNKCKDLCIKLHNAVQAVYGEYAKYLESVKTKESETQSTWLDNSYIDLEEKVRQYLRTIKMINSEKIEIMSQSGKSEISGVASSTMNSATAKAVEAKAAQVRFKFAEQETNLKKKQAEINADLELLKYKKEVEVLVTEAEELAKIESSQKSSVLGDSLPEQDPLSKVGQYILNHGTQDNEKYLKLADQEKSVTAQFLLRKDLILSRLTKFNDTCGNYQAWKVSFKSISDEMLLSSSEEIDLLIKYLGPSSRKHAVSLRTAYLHDANQALIQIWQRLDERFGTPESVLSSLTNRLQAFPILTNKDRVRLYELADLLQEIEGLMSNPQYHKTLSYFDSSIGVNPIVNKLPYSLQQKWIAHASTYKESHSVPFPPFSFFTSFVKKFSVIFNGPNFAFKITASNRQRSRNSSHYDQKVSSSRVAAAKTEIQSDKKSSVLNDKCLIHKGAPHRLSECKRFQCKSEEEKRSFLSENKLCYKCYSPSHQARNCKESWKPTNSYGGEKQSSTYGLRDTWKSTNHREEKDSSFGQNDSLLTEQKQNVNIKCTEICKNDHVQGKSCAKIILVRIYVKNSPDIMFIAMPLLMNGVTDV
ncbi:uncharacterized protein LOC132757303 [Ruditapes philippinarum]|uniref:uncharacterized protein LOC132757303 n=1 Tax=Ruditapes philippinarum TaxID=129788 RepID=UPI00295C2471|nr:uncharacterized protein LOC132757303 [Ruditapes philippinarum]